MPTLLLQNIFTLVCLKEIVGRLVVGNWILVVGICDLSLSFLFYRKDRKVFRKETKCLEL